MNTLIRSAVIKSYAEDIYGKNIVEISLNLRKFERIARPFNLLKKSYKKSFLHDFQKFLVAPL